MTTRTVSGSGAATASFVYDGDGNRVQGTVNGVTTSYIGDYFEWAPSEENLVANPGFETTGNWTEATVSGFASTWFYRSTWGTADWVMVRFILKVEDGAMISIEFGRMIVLYKDNIVNRISGILIEWFYPQSDKIIYRGA